MKKYVRTQFNSDLKNVIFSRGIIASFFLDEDVSINMVNEVKTVVSEAVTNAIVHGYKGDNDGIVSMDLEFDKNLLAITINDKGIGIEDIEKAKEPLYSTKITEERAGLGFTIMEIFSDSLEVESKVNEGTTIYIKKYLS